MFGSRTSVANEFCDWNEQRNLLVNEKGDVGMAKHFSNKYGNKG